MLNCLCIIVKNYKTSFTVSRKKETIGTKNNITFVDRKKLTVVLSAHNTWNHTVVQQNYYYDKNNGKLHTVFSIKYNNHFKKNYISCATFYKILNRFITYYCDKYIYNLQSLYVVLLLTKNDHIKKPILASDDIVTLDTTPVSYTATGKFFF